jgi:large subunit ribosomal protein L23
MNAFDVIKAPVITEKGTLVAENGQVVFKVDPRATKFEIRQAVESLFDCKVKEVRTVNYLGKRTRRFGRVYGAKPSWKKAYVTLADASQTVDLLEKI